MPDNPTTARFASSLPRWFLYGGIALVLIASALQLPNRWADLQRWMPVIGLWSNPDAQCALMMQMSDAPDYRFLKAADSLMPRDATVLLVTSGRDVEHLDYTAFHRTLYFLAPRPVWWAASSPHDGSWKSRWWVSSPITAEAVRQLAETKGASYVITYGLQQPLSLGREVAQGPGLRLLQLTPTPPAATGVQPVSVYAGPYWPLQVAAALAVILILGSMVVAAIGRLGYRAAGLEAVALAWSLGAGLLSTLMFLLSRVSVHLDWQLALLSILAILSITFRWRAYHVMLATILRRLKLLPHQPQELNLSRLANMGVTAVLGLLLIANTALIALMAVGRPLQVWDSWVNWGMKARIIYLEGPVSPHVYADPSRAVTQLDYPLLTPLLEGWLYKWLGAPDDRFAGLITLLFYLSLIALCYTCLRGLNVRSLAALAATTALATIPHITGLASLVFAEMPLLVFALVAGTYLVKWLDGGSVGALLIACMGAGLLPWAKKEGLLLLATLCIATLLSGFRRGRAWQAVGGMLVAASILAGPWWLLVAANQVVSDVFLPLTPGNLASNLGRSRTILQLAWERLLDPMWSLIWPTVTFGGLLALFLRRKTQGTHRAGALPLTAALYIALSAGTYFFSNFVPYEQHILASYDRLAAQVLPLLVVWLVYRVTSPAIMDDAEFT